MKFLFVINFPFYRPGGALVILAKLYEYLSKCGHEVKAVHTVSSFHFDHEKENTDQAIRDLKAYGRFEDDYEFNWPLDFEHEGAEIHYIENTSKLRDYLKEIKQSYVPDIVHVMPQAIALHASTVFDSFPSEKIIYTCHASIGLNFGPNDLGFKNRMHEFMKASSGIWVPSQYLKDYLLEHGDLNSEVLRIPVYGDPPFKKILSDHSQFVTLINAGVWKGVTIFIELAKMFTTQKFSVVTTWNSGDKYVEELKKLDNVEIWNPVSHIQIDKIYSKVKVLLVPTIIDESFGLVAVEAMLRGIPVIASDVGGLPEAKLGVPYLVPVNKYDLKNELIEKKAGIDKNVPDQYMEKWAEYLEKLLNDEKHYCDISDASFTAACSFVESLDEKEIMHFFEKCRNK